MRDLPHVTIDKSTGNYAYVRRWPVDVELALPGSRFFRSLGIKDRRALLEPWSIANREYNSMVARARGTPVKFAESDGEPLPLPSWDELLNAIREWERSELERRYKAVGNGYAPPESRFYEECDAAGALGRGRQPGRTPESYGSPPPPWAVQVHAMRGSLAALRAKAREIITARGIALDMDVPSHLTGNVMSAVSQAWCHVLEREYEWRCGNWTRPPERYAVTAAAVANAPAPAKDTRLSQLLASYVEFSKAGQASKNRATKVVNYLIDHLGEDRAADLVTPLDMDAFRVAVSMLPGDKHESRKNRPLREFKRNPLPPERRMSDHTIYSWWTMCNAVYNWGINRKIVTQNPVRLPEEPKNPMNPRGIHTPSGMQKIDQHPATTTGAPSAAWYWFHRMAKYTAMRPEEIAQLSIYDVRFDDPDLGFYIDVNARPDERRGKTREIAACQSVKTGDERKIPIHPELLRLGFRQYLESQSGPWLFPDLPHTTGSTSHGKFAAEFARVVLKPLGLKQPNEIFYPFRHTFKIVADRCGVHPKALSAIMGHSASRMIREIGASLTTERYGQAGAYGFLAEEICKVKYEGERDDLPWTALRVPTKQAAHP